MKDAEKIVSEMIGDQKGEVAGAPSELPPAPVLRGYAYIKPLGNKLHLLKNLETGQEEVFWKFEE